MDKILNGDDRAIEVSFTDRLGKVTFTKWRELLAYLNRLHNHQELPTEYSEENPVYMRIDFGRMLADCECGGSAYVTPDDPFFYCLTCQNQKSGGLLRHVIFPENLEEICSELLRMDVETIKTLPPTQAAALAKGTPRNWRMNDNI